MEKTIIVERGRFDALGLYYILSYVVCDSIETAMYFAQEALKQFDDGCSKVERTGDKSWTVRTPLAGGGTVTGCIVIREHIPVTLSLAKDTVHGMKK